MGTRDGGPALVGKDLEIRMASKAKQQPKEEAPEKEADGATESPLQLLDLSLGGFAVRVASISVK